MITNRFLILKMLTVLNLIRYFENRYNLYLNVQQCKRSLAGDIVKRLNVPKPHFIQITFNDFQRLAVRTLLNVGILVEQIFMSH